MTDFNWYADDESIVFNTVRGIAIYVNGSHEIVLRQEAGPDDDDDSIILIPLFMVDRVISSIKNAVIQAQENIDEG